MTTATSSRSSHARHVRRLDDPQAKPGTEQRASIARRKLHPRLEIQFCDSPSCAAVVRDMGKGGDAGAPRHVQSKSSSRVPTEKPEFTVGTLRRAIPPHCFDRSLQRSLSYLAADLVAVAALYFASTFIDQPAIPRWLAYGLLWPAYWFFQGAVGTGVWVIAHECGHQAFSKWQVVNDLVGLMLHTCLLVPYYSWYVTPLAAVCQIYPQIDIADHGLQCL